MTVHSQIDDLVRRGVLNVTEGRTTAKWNMHYSASNSLITAVRNNHDLLPYDHSETTADDMWQMIGGMLHDCDYSNIARLDVKSFKLISPTSRTNMSVRVRSIFKQCSRIIARSLQIRR